MQITKHGQEKITKCGLCHECQTPLRSELDGEEWCPQCQKYKRYPSHGWSGSPIGCPMPIFTLVDATSSETEVLWSENKTHEEAQRRNTELRQMGSGKRWLLGPLDYWLES